jgi:hypothetical protein
MNGSRTAFTYLHSTPGRMRIRIPDRRGDDGFSVQIERDLVQHPGVQQVQANPLTGSVLILFDPRCIDDRQILSELERIGLDSDLISSPQPPMTVTDLPVRIGAALGKELVKAALSQVVGNSPVSLLLALI